MPCSRLINWHSKVLFLQCFANPLWYLRRNALGGSQQLFSFNLLMKSRGMFRVQPVSNCSNAKEIYIEKDI